MKALLVRVGVDQAYGKWNAPVHSDGRFIFVPIPENEKSTFRPGQRRSYTEVIPALDRFCAKEKLDLCDDLKFPVQLRKGAMHLDPDFDHLTYGDNGARRGARITAMGDGDLLIFYSGLLPIHPCEHKLLYALVGLFVVQEVVSILNIPDDRSQENAHTRKVLWGQSDIVVRAKPGVSGRLERCIPIGEKRAGAYRIRNDLLALWGGLSVKDGFVQRSAVPPALNQPSRFYDWFLKTGSNLMRGNGWDK